MGDQYLFESSMMTDAPKEPFLKKEVIWVNDTQNGAYQGQIQYDFSQIANSAKWASWGEATLEVPFTILVENVSADTAGSWENYINSFMVGLKSGTHQLINSINVQYNSTSIVQLTNYTNFYVQFKLLTSMGPSDTAKWSDSLFFTKDTATTFSYAGPTGLAGQGFTNNRPTVSGVYGATGLEDSSLDYSTHKFHGQDANSAYAQRMRNVVDTTSTNFYSGIVTPSKLAQQGTHLFEQLTATSFKFSLLCTIRLKDVADVFDKLPLVKGAFITMTVNYNSSVQTVQATPTSWELTSAPQLNGLTNPLLIASAEPYQPNSWLPALCGVTGTFNPQQARISSNIVSAYDKLNVAKRNSILGATRLSIPVYTMNPVFEQQYISNPIKDVYYSDIYSYTIRGIAAGGEINQLITNGISQPLACIVIPCIAKASNLGFTQQDIWQSPFTTEPGTTSPTALVTNFNLQISGQNIFQQNQQYDYDTFLNELRQINAINGGNSTGLTSGLLTQQDFQFGFRYYVADLSRRLPGDDVARSILVLGTNNTSVAMDYICIVQYQRKLSIDLRTGGIVPTGGKM